MARMSRHSGQVPRASGARRLGGRFPASARPCPSEAGTLRRKMDWPWPGAGFPPSVYGRLTRFGRPIPAERAVSASMENREPVTVARGLGPTDRAGVRAFARQEGRTEGLGDGGGLDMPPRSRPTQHFAHV